MLNHLSLRSNVAGSVLVMGFLGILLAILVAETYREYAIESQRTGFEQIIGLQVNALFDDLTRVSHDLGQALQGDKKFQEFLRNKDASGLDEHLQSQFHQYFVTAGVVKLESLAVYDKKFTLFSRALADAASVNANCPDLKIRAAKRKGALRLKTITELCLVEGKPYFSMLLPIGGLRVKGYLEIVTDPVYSLQAIESNLGMPLRIRYQNGKTAYESTQWPTEQSGSQTLVANFRPLTEQGEDAFTLSLLKDMSEFEAQLEHAQNKYIAAGIFISVLIAAMMISILNKTALTPLMRLGEQLRSIRLDKKQLGKTVVVSGNREVSELAEGFNEMTDELKALYDSLSSHNDELSQEVRIRESAEKELKKHRDHLEDLVEQRTLDLASARDAALDASRSKSLFLANMSHELRTPLNAIIGYSEMMMEEVEEAGDQQHLNDLAKIHSSGRHLLTLINDILDLTKIEAGKMDLYEEWFDVSTMLNTIVDTIQPLFIKNDNKIDVSCPDNIGDLYADLTKIRQSLFNLLSNAGKFSPGGEIVLTVRRETLNGQDIINFSVKDNGIGMSQEQQERLFEAFSQADPSTTRRFGGTGLGLVISQHFCNMMGGDISIISASGQGSTFTISLPIKKGPALPSEDKNSVTQIAWQVGAIAEGKRFSETDKSENIERRESVVTVLVIDDDPSVRRIMSHFLSQKGFDVQTVTSGEEGLLAAKKIKPAVITLDVMMPGQDGWSVLKALKQDPDLCDVPVILVTMVENRGLGYSLGAVECLSKPIDKTRLFNVVSRCVRHKSHGPLLIVEDDAAMRESMKDILCENGWDVDAVASAESAFSSVGNNPPALILLDMQMPTMDGFEFLDQLRHNRRWRNIPVIVVTGKELSEDEVRRLHAHSASVIGKAAFEHAELLQEIRSLVEKNLSPQFERLDSAVSAD